MAGLQALGIDFVSTGTDYPFGAEATAPGLFDTSGASPVNLGQAGASVAQEFTAVAGGLNLVLVSTGGGGSTSCRLALTVQELPGARQVARAGAPCNSPATTFAFPPLPDSAGKRDSPSWIAPKARRTALLAR